MNFSWDDGKRSKNLTKHGLDFADVKRFGWEVATYGIDDRNDYGETREIAVGLLDGRLVVIIFERRDASVRIISMRKANRREVGKYARS